MLVGNVTQEKLSITFHARTQYHDEQLKNNNNQQKLGLPVFPSIYFRSHFSLMIEADWSVIMCKRAFKIALVTY